MLIPVQLALAAMLNVETPFIEAAETDPASAPRQIAAIPMAWRVGRKVGDVPGEKSCIVTSLGGDVTVRLFKERASSQATWSVFVGHDNQPGSLRYLRINKEYYTTDRQSFRGIEAAEIVERLKSPGEFAFEWAQRPDFAKRQGLFGTGDFAVKAAECADWMSGERAATQISR